MNVIDEYHGKRNSKVRYTTYLTGDLVKRLKVASAEHNVPMTYLVQRGVERLLDELDSQRDA